MTCEKRVQKFRTDEANFQPIRHTSQILVVTRHQDGMSALVQTSFRGASQWWRSKMSAVFSRYIQGYKWFCVDSIVFVSLNSTELQSWNRAGLLWAHNLRYKTSGFDTVRIITVLPRLIMRRLYFLYNFRKWRHREKKMYISKRMLWPLSLLSRLMSATVEPGYNEEPRDWQIWFSMPRFRCIEFLFHILYYYWGKDNRLLYWGLRYIEVRYIEVPL